MQDRIQGGSNGPIKDFKVTLSYKYRQTVKLRKLEIGKEEIGIVCLRTRHLTICDASYFLIIPLSIVLSFFVILFPLLDDIAA